MENEPSKWRWLEKVGTFITVHKLNAVFPFGSETFRNINVIVSIRFGSVAQMEILRGAQTLEMMLSLWTTSRF